MRIATAWLAALGLICISAAAHARPFKKGPYLQNVSATSVTIMWESGRELPGVVEVLGKTPQRIEVDKDEMHEVEITGLEPAHRYRYRVVCGDKTSTGEFATAPSASVPFSFIAFGDTRSNAGSHRRVVERIRREVPDFVLATGDMVDDGGKLAQWQQFFDIERNLLKENVMYPSIGNHDRQGRGRTAHNFRKFFSVPENSPDPERYYAFTYGNSRFLILDSNVYGFELSDQNAWIKRQLQSARLDKKIRHIFVSMHHPPFSISLHGGRKELREAWTPLFERYGVAAVFSGHDHVYSRAEHNGVQYFVTGGGGAPLYPRGRRPSRIDRKATKYFERVNHYLRVHVVGDMVEISAFRADATVIEVLSWGTPPRPAPVLAADDAAPADSAVAAPTIGAAGGGRVTEAYAAAPGSSGGGGGGGLGLLGKLGALIMLAAGAVLIWTLRRA